MPASWACARSPIWRRAPRSLSIAGDYEFFGRPEWKAIRDAYGLSFGRERQMQAEFMYPAAAAGEVDVISAYASDGRIAEFGLTVLDDPKQAIPPYDAILLVSPKRAKDAAFLAALRPLIDAIDVADHARSQPPRQRRRHAPKPWPAGWGRSWQRRRRARPPRLQRRGKIEREAI